MSFLTAPLFMVEWRSPTTCNPTIVGKTLARPGAFHGRPVCVWRRLALFLTGYSLRVFFSSSCKRFSTLALKACCLS
jgi:hypothetical protein